MPELLLLISLVLISHFVADFVFQTDWMAKNKSKDNRALGLHVLVYTGVLFLGTFWFLGVWYALLNGVIHFAVDYVTSRMTSRLYAKGDIHNFFVVVGFDQLVHALTLIWTITLFLRL